MFKYGACEVYKVFYRLILAFNMLAIFVAVSFIEFILSHESWIHLICTWGRKEFLQVLMHSLDSRGIFILLLQSLEGIKDWQQSGIRYHQSLDLGSESNFPSDPSIISPCFGIPPLFLHLFLECRIFYFFGSDHLRIFHALRPKQHFSLQVERTCPEIQLFTKNLNFL